MKCTRPIMRRSTHTGSQGMGVSCCDAELSLLRGVINLVDILEKIITVLFDLHK